MTETMAGHRSFSPTRTDVLTRAAMTATGALPAPVVRMLAGRPVDIDGQRLDPVFRLGIRAIGLIGRGEYEDMPVARARRALERQAYTAAGPRIELPRVENLRIPVRDAEIDARLYSPVASDERLPLLVWFHGGGWTLGSIDSHDAVCRRLARDARVRVLSVDYRLAPEHRFPSAVHDALDSFRWARDNAQSLSVDPDRIAVGGDSAGGNLAAVVCQQTVAAGETPPAFQLLVVPAVDMSTRTDSYRMFGSGFLLTAANMDFYERSYIRSDADRSDVRASPLLADDFTGLPPAHVSVAGFDPLRDEGEAYARRLEQAGVPVSLRRHSAVIHAFSNAAGSTPAAASAFSEAIGALRAGLAY